MIDTMFNTIAGKRIAILGFAFKKDTNDTRQSPAIDVCHALLNEKAQLAIYDPRVNARTILNELAQVTGLSVSELETRIACERDPYHACDGAHALAVLTEWDEFKTLDFEIIYRSMTKPAFVFDGRNVLPHAQLQLIGFEVQAIGKPLPLLRAAESIEGVPA
jgi:UDPglucose 6-dehydrogenase